MRSRCSIGRFNSREWGDVTMRSQVTHGRSTSTSASAIETVEIEKTPHTITRTIDAILFVFKLLFLPHIKHKHTHIMLNNYAPEVSLSINYSKGFTYLY